MESTSTSREYLHHIFISLSRTSRYSIAIESIAYIHILSTCSRIFLPIFRYFITPIQQLVYLEAQRLPKGWNLSCLIAWLLNLIWLSRSGKAIKLTFGRIKHTVSLATRLRSRDKGVYVQQGQVVKCHRCNLRGALQGA
jgi:hypothetical protein